MRRAIGRDALGHGVGGGDIGEPSLGQIAPHFHFRMDTRRHLADQLEHQVVADDQRAIGLFDTQVLDLDVRIQREVLGLIIDLEAQFTRRQGELGPLVEGVEHAMHEAGQGEGIGHQANAAHVPDAGDGQLGRQRAAVLVLFGEEAQRQRITLLALGVRHHHFAEHHRQLGGIDLGGVVQTHAGDGLVLGTEPAALGQIDRQHLFEDATRLAIEQLLQIALDHYRLVVGHRRWWLGVPGGHLFVAGQVEPVEAIGR